MLPVVPNIEKNWEREIERERERERASQDLQSNWLRVKDEGWFTSVRANPKIHMKFQGKQADKAVVIVSHALGNNTHHLRTNKDNRFLSTKEDEKTSDAGRNVSLSWHVPEETCLEELCETVMECSSDAYWINQHGCARTRMRRHTNTQKNDK